MYSSVDNKTRLEILRLIAELDNPVGAETLIGRLEERGISITVDAVRYHLRVLDDQGCTSRVGNRGRVLTPDGWQELQRSLVDTRMRFGLAKTETLAQQVSFDPGSLCGQVAASLTIFPEDRLATVLSHLPRVCRAGICVSDRMAVLHPGERLGGVPVTSGKVGIVTISTATIDGLLLSHGILFRPTFGGIVEVAAWHPYRFVDVVDYGYASRDPVEILIRPGSTRVRGTVERGYGLITADVREVVGVGRERTRRLLRQLGDCGLGGVLMVGQVGQPILGIPVQQHTFGIALVAGINPPVAAYEAGVPAEFACSEGLVDYSLLKPIEELAPTSQGEDDGVGGVLVAAERAGVWAG